jgi:hypothetical protein
MKKYLAAVLAAMACGVGAEAEILISEVFYNPNGSEAGLHEWVEITNTGATDVDLSGWKYGDIQDGNIANPFAAGTILAAGKSAIVVAQSSSQIAAMWGAGVQVINYTGGGSGTTPDGVTLANAPSATNETAAILNASDVVIDSVNFETGTNGWPTGVQGFSIYLLPGEDKFTTAGNDVGSNWAVSAIGVDGAYQALVTNPGIANATALDVASPGTAVIPEPAAAALMILGLAAAARRRA